MDYAIIFLEGIITFISPCLLPMLPLYFSYFIGTEDMANTSKSKKNNLIINTLAFVLGFTVVFVLLGVAAGSIGKFIFRHSNIINLVTGSIVIFFGLHYLGLFKINFLNREKRLKVSINPVNFFKAFLFGIVFSVGWTPCIGTFLSSALLIAANSKTSMKGALLLFTYSMGLGLPFILSTLIFDNLIGTFNFIKKNYDIIVKISGLFLVVVGIFMITGLFNMLLSYLSF